MIVDLRGTRVILVIGICGFTFQVGYGRLHTGWLAAFTSNQVNLVLAAPVLGMLALALWKHRTSAALLRANLATLSIRQHPTSLVRPSPRFGRTATPAVGELRVPALALAALTGAAVAVTVFAVAAKIRAWGSGRT
jgi:hypothetical protein